MVAQTPEQRFVGVIEAARRADVHYMTIRRWLVDGRLTRHQPAGCKKILIDVNELDALIHASAAKQATRS
jgi:excisionase family DNA binding protein